MKPLTVIIFALVLTLGAGLPAAAQSTVLSINPSSPLERGIEKLKAGELDSAIRLFETVLAGNPAPGRKAVAANNLCITHDYAENYAAALDACTAALNADGSYWQAYVNRGNVHYRIGDYEAAEADYRKALALNEDEPAIRENLKLVNRLTASR